MVLLIRESDDKQKNKFNAILTIERVERWIDEALTDRAVMKTHFFSKKNI